MMKKSTTLHAPFLATATLNSSKQFFSWAALFASFCSELPSLSCWKPSHPNSVDFPKRQKLGQSQQIPKPRWKLKKWRNKKCKKKTTDPNDFQMISAQRHQFRVLTSALKCMPSHDTRHEKYTLHQMYRPLSHYGTTSVKLWSACTMHRFTTQLCWKMWCPDALPVWMSEPRCCTRQALRLA